MPLPQYGTAYIFMVALTDTANPGRLLINPTVVAGDFKIVRDTVGPVNLTNTPTPIPGTPSVLVSLTAAEMTTPSGLGKIEVYWSDPDFAWADGYIFFDAPTNYLTTLDLQSLGTFQMTEEYAADGIAPTRDQMLFMLWSALSQFIISGTSINAKKLDGVTDAMQFQMDSPTIPTQRVRIS